MELANETTVQEFVLLGFGAEQQKRFLLFIFFSILYMLSLVENITIISLVLIDAHLGQIPMYILLGNFSWLEICYVTSTVPRMLFDLAFPPGVISFQACFLQFYVFFSLGGTESFFLSVMALDRYLAICHPLHYTKIMSKNTCYALITATWAMGFSSYIVPVTLISRLSFCGPNTIDHFLCDPGPILSLACPPLNKVPFILQFSMNILVILCSFLFIGFSYCTVIFTLMRSSNKGSHRKSFSTISFHLVIVALFYGPVLGMYITPVGGSHSQLAKIVTVFYTAVTPFLNPLIYCLRNDQVKQALWRLQKRTEKWLRRKVTV